MGRGSSAGAVDDLCGVHGGRWEFDRRAEADGIPRFSTSVIFKKEADGNYHDLVEEKREDMLYGKWSFSLVRDLVPRQSEWQSYIDKGKYRDPYAGAKKTGVAAFFGRV